MASLATVATDTKLEDYVKELIKADKEICSISGKGWEPATSPDDAWNYCRDTYNDKIGDLPKIEELKKLGESNGKEHGKRFEENLKLLSSLVFTKKVTGEPFLTKDDSDKILKQIPGYTKKKPRKFKTKPMTLLYFLEETEHKNDEKDIDTEQLLDFESKLKNNKKADKNPLKGKGIRSKYSWDYHDEQLAQSRELVRKMIGSGVNIKCARFGSDNDKEGDEYECYPKAIDCASCITFWEETKKGGEEKWLFVVGIWDQDEKNEGNIHSNVKCLKGVWFLEMDKSDLKNLWGCEDTEEDKKEMGKNIKDIHDKIEALKRFNKQRKTKKDPAQIQRAHLKGLYYYGNIEKIEERLKDKKGNIKATWWDDDAIKQCKKEKENMAYGGCVPLLNTLTEILTRTKALLKYTPKVQLDKAQARLQCNITGSNFRELIERKRKTGKAIFSRDFTYLFRPIIPVQGKTQGGGGKERRAQYDQWLFENGAIESEEDFFFENDTPYGFPIFLNDPRTIDIINKEPDLKKEFINKEFYIPDIFDDIDEDPNDIEDDDDCEDTKFPELEGVKKHEKLVYDVEGKAKVQIKDIDDRYEELIEEAQSWGLSDDRFKEYKNLVELTAKSSVSRPRVTSGMDPKNYMVGPRRTNTSGSVGSIFGSPLLVTSEVPTNVDRPLARMDTIEKGSDSDDSDLRAEKGSSTDSGDDSSKISGDRTKVQADVKSAFDEVSDVTSSFEKTSLKSGDSSSKGSKGYSAHKSDGKKSGHDASRRKTGEKPTIGTQEINEEEGYLRDILHSKIDGMNLLQLNDLNRHVSDGSNLKTNMVRDITPTSAWAEGRVTSGSISSAQDAFGTRSAPSSPKKEKVKSKVVKEEAPIDSWYGIKILEARNRLDISETLGDNWLEIWRDYEKYVRDNFGEDIFKTPDEVDDPTVGKPQVMKDFISYVSNWVPGVDWLPEEDRRKVKGKSKFQEGTVKIPKKLQNKFIKKLQEEFNINNIVAQGYILDDFRDKYYEEKPRADTKAREKWNDDDFINSWIENAGDTNYFVEFYDEHPELKEDDLFSGGKRKKKKRKKNKTRRKKKKKKKKTRTKK